MLYQLYEWNHAALTPFRAVADATRLFYQNPLNPMSHTTAGRSLAAIAELFERTTRVYGKPQFGLDETTIRGYRVPVVDKPVWSKPFCDLLHFERALPKGHGKDPRILIVAPMSGHYATLLRGTVEALLPYADVYITDWKDARTVPLSMGAFNLDSYVDYVIEILRFLGPDTHVIGVCQPAVPVLMATAVMEEAEDPCAPATMTLMGGPIDTRINPTAVNDLAKERGIDWFRDNVIMSVPFPHAGFMRQVYPGFLQLTGFMSMNLDRHVIAYKDFFWHLVKDDGDPAEKHRTFYDEYNAVMDMTAEFYLQTVDEVFVKHSLPKGEITHHGKRVDLTAIRRTGLLTVEGENDDISGVGQTEAAQTLCVNIPEDKRVHYVQAKVGHYGVFNGSRYRAEIAPRIVDFALTHGTTHTGAKPPKAPAETGKGPHRIGAYAERQAKAGTLGRTVSMAGESGVGAVAGLGGFNAAMNAMAAPAKAMMSTAMEAANLSFGSFAGSNNSGFSAPYIAREPARTSGATASPAATNGSAPKAQPAETPKTASTKGAEPQKNATTKAETPAAKAEPKSDEPAAKAEAIAKQPDDKPTSKPAVASSKASPAAAPAIKAEPAAKAAGAKTDGPAKPEAPRQPAATKDDAKAEKPAEAAATKAATASPGTAGKAASKPSRAKADALSAKASDDRVAEAGEASDLFADRSGHAQTSAPQKRSRSTTRPKRSTGRARRR
ncbi:polyhydroxyalkanoate depolymerase [Jiella sp. KSK16Y-1]|uniref:Polyhydroxyalkanoate depolymerase n=1 Tax=Jiella mangrovi TaxID=2821407 RepID=A0ABS4BFL3_9HYPH|nr:polyhydroxyalkanoate depolymerase [Jiella mangrovi]